MTGFATKSTTGSPADAKLIAGILLALLAEAMVSTALVLGGSDIAGDIYVSPDEFAWIDILYTTGKMIGFLIAPWLLERNDGRRLAIIVVLILGGTSVLALTDIGLNQFVAVRIAQGLSGGILLVAAQVLVFLCYPKHQQPILQTAFAIGAVVAPSSATLGLQGWLIDMHSWPWIFFSVVPVSLAAAGLLLSATVPTVAQPQGGPFDFAGVSLVSIALLSFTYLLSQGPRWNWFEQPHIFWLCIIGASSLCAFIGQQFIMRRHSLFAPAVFKSDDFCFALAVSFVAGAALYGTAFLIPNFAATVLAFTPSKVGALLFPGGLMFASALSLSAWLFQSRGLTPFATVPIGIFFIMTAMWILSGSTSESGADNMLVALLARGLGLGFLFLSITLIAFSRLPDRVLPSGIAIFNICRQLGGLIGIAALQTIIDRDVASSKAILGANFARGNIVLANRLDSASEYFAAKGIDGLDADIAATALVAKLVSEQARVLAFDTAFLFIVALFLAAAPVLIATRIMLSLLMKRPNISAHE